MDRYIQGRNGNNGSLSHILRTQAKIQAEALRQISIKASGFINHDEVRYSFLKNVEAFTEAQLECIESGRSHAEKTQALAYLREEQDYLEKQIGWLESKQVQPAASVEVRIINGVLSYVVKSIGLVGGILEVVSGSVILWAGSPTVIGSVFGVMLIAHGYNNIIENYYSLFLNDDNAIGPMTYVYGEAANLLGYDRAYGKLAFAGMDLILSATGLLSMKLLPDAWRLIRYLPSDYERNFRTMSALELSLEIAIDSATLYSGSQVYFSLPESSYQPPVPFNDY
ncbi:DUF4225 domain-containing protein [Enterobacter asburiae]|nr:DUF4225 domain-containing protein [Enterobacter asburiae]